MEANPASVPSVEPQDDGDPFGGDPDVGAGIGSESPASGIGSEPGRPSGAWNEPPATSGGASVESNAGLWVQCLALTDASVPVKEEFCRSLPDPGWRALCWRYRYSRIQWIGWCHFQFGD